jgi:hypothetical protein
MLLSVAVLGLFAGALVTGRPQEVQRDLQAREIPPPTSSTTTTTTTTSTTTTSTTTTLPPTTTDDQHQQQPTASNPAMRSETIRELSR